MRFYLICIAMRKTKWNTKIPYELTGKIIDNAMRIFENNMSKPQFKAVKSTIRWVRKQTTVVLSHLYEWEHVSSKQAEKLSYHLWNVELTEIVEEKALKIARNKIKEATWKVIISYDESDLYKPDAKKMPWLSRIRDGSTGLTWNWYIFRWVNIWWVSILSRIDEEVWEKKKWEKTVECLNQTKEQVWKQVWVYVIDRWWDCTWVHSRFANDNKEDREEYAIRAKKNRVLLEKKTGNKKKIISFKSGKHEVKLNSWENVYLHVIHRKWFKTNLYLFTNIDEETETIVNHYLARRSIEKDFAKMKQLWLEGVRLMSMLKIKNILAITQFIIVLWQEIYEKVMERVDTTYQHINLHYKKYCKWRSLTENPTSFLKFISYNLDEYLSYKLTPEPINTLFGWRRELKKLGVI